MMMTKVYMVAAVLCGAMVVSVLPGGAAADRNLKGVLTVAGINRSYEVHVPASYGGREPVPLLMVLHGSSASGAVMRLYSRFNECSERNNFIVAYPDSLGPYWNDGRVDMNSVSYKANIDDVRFISGLIDQLVSRYSVDAGRVYIAGFSNGGMMALRLGIAIPEKLAAISSVSGLLPKHLSYLRPARPLPVMIIQGTEAPIVPSEGGKLDGKHGEILSAVDTAAYWSARNECSTPVGVQVLPDNDPDDGTLVFRVTYSCEKSESEVVLLTIQGGGHSWPGTRIPLVQKKWGKTCMDIDATAVIWDFFSCHRRA